MLALEKLFKSGNQKVLINLKIFARKKAYQNRSNLKWETKQKGRNAMSINIGGGELRELKPRILVLGVGGAVMQ